MNRFNFPFAYTPKVNLKNTIIYSSVFQQEIVNYFKNKYKCTYIDPAFIVDNKKSCISYLEGDRIFSFDNKTNNSIFLFNSCQDNYLMINSSLFKNQNIITVAPFFKRDATQTNLDSIVNWEIDAELSIPINMNLDYFATLTKEIYHQLVKITQSEQLIKIYSPSKSKINLKTIKIVDAQKIESSYPTLSLEEALHHFCAKNQFVIVLNNIKKLISGKSIAPSIATAQDNNLSCGLYVYDEQNNKPILLINVCKRPTGATSKEQINNTNPLEITNDLYDQRIFEEKRPTNISVVINYTNLLFYLLDKIHLAEVVKSVWPDDFIDFVNSEKIEIF